MTKQHFEQWNSESYKHGSKDVVGGRPQHTKLFKLGSDTWEVWVFDIYTIQKNQWTGDIINKDHTEYIAFKNGLLEEWGSGDLPITIKQNPNQFQHDINIRNISN